MNNTALRAGAQSANNTHMVFANEEHEKFYYEKLEQARYQGWQTSGSVKVVRLAFNLYTDGMPSVDDNESRDEQTDECRGYSVSDIFCCGYALYFWQGIRLRYPEYCREQRSVEEILAEMERKRAENSTDGNEE